MVETVFALETSHAEIVAEITQKVGFSTGADGKIRSKRSGKTLWKPRPKGDTMTLCYPWIHEAIPSAAAFAVYGTYNMALLGQTFCDEMPNAILDLVIDEPNSNVAQRWRRYVRTAYFPEVRRVADIVTAHSATMEW